MSDASGGGGFDLLAYGAALEKSLPKRRAADACALLVERVLAPLLPSTIVIGSGVIADAHARTLPVELLLYRAGFPVFRDGDQTIYLCEGVLAAISVHARLTPAELRAAWELTSSVRELSPAHAPAPTRPLGGAAKKGGGRNVLDELLEQVGHKDGGAATVAVSRNSEPASERVRTYVCALDAVPEAALSRAVLECSQRMGPGGAPDCLWIRGRSVSLRVGDDTLPATASGEPGTYLSTDESPLGWTLAHLWRGALMRAPRLPPVMPYLSR